jgi:L-ribulose-5-phosphate 3-epimerase
LLVKSISYWSFPGGLDGSKPVAEAFEEAKKAGFDAVEVCLSEKGDVSLETTEKSAKAVVQAAADAGVEIASVACGLFWGKSLTDNDEPVRREAIAIARHLINVGAWLNAGAVLIIPGAVDVFFDPTAQVVDYHSVLERAESAIAALLPQAEETQIALAIENVWNKFLVGPYEMREFIDHFDSPWLGAYFDVGNAMLTGYPEHWIRMLGRRIKRVHFKDFRRAVGTVEGFVDLLSGDVNWPEVVRALNEIGYDGPVTAEMIPIYKYYPEVLIANTSQAMDAILGRK